jgi:hypothetical protein
MLYYIPAPVLAGILFVATVIAYLFGLRVRLIRSKRDSAFQAAGIGPLEGALLGLFSLLLAFTFNQSANDYAAHRDLLVTESNAVETALWRADLYPDSVRQAFRRDFKDYLEARVAYYQAGTDEDVIREARKRSAEASGRIWERASRASLDPGNALRSSQMLPAINSIIDAEARRDDARRRHIPDPILWLLFGLCVVGSFIVGYANSSRKIDWVVLLSYSIMAIMTIYVILDLDRPRRGLIETSSAHQNMVRLLHEVSSQ